MQGHTLQSDHRQPARPPARGGVPAVLALALAVALSLGAAEGAAATVSPSEPDLRHWSGVLERAVRELACQGRAVAAVGLHPAQALLPRGRPVAHLPPVELDRAQEPPLRAELLDLPPPAGH